MEIFVSYVRSDSIDTARYPRVAVFTVRYLITGAISSRARTAHTLFTILGPCCGTSSRVRQREPYRVRFQSWTVNLITSQSVYIYIYIHKTRWNLSSHRRGCSKKGEKERRIGQGRSYSGVFMSDTTFALSYEAGAVAEAGLDRRYRYPSPIKWHCYPTYRRKKRKRIEINCAQGVN